MVIEPGKYILIVTSNYPIAKCFRNEEDIKAIERRFTQIEMKKNNKTMIEAMEMNEQVLSGNDPDENAGITDEEIEKWVELGQQAGTEEGEREIDELMRKAEEEIAKHAHEWQD
jgi:uncharacterized ubiquitin-like protein YukD